MYVSKPLRTGQKKLTKQQWETLLSTIQTSFEKCHPYNADILLNRTLRDLEAFRKYKFISPEEDALLQFFAVQCADALTGLFKWNDGNNRCVCCGEIIPEGRQVCPICEGGKK